MKGKLEYKWIILFTCCLMAFVCLGFCSSNKGLYLSAITNALGLKRSLFSLNDTCRYVATAITNLFFGSLMSRFGTRKMAAFGFLSLIAATLIYSFAENIFVFYIGGTLLGIGFSFTSITMASTIIRQWFHKDIGTYTGIAFAASGIGGAVAAQIVTPLINEPGNPFGYRNAYLLVSAILLITGIVVALLLRESPTGSTAAKKKVRGATWVGLPYVEARKKSYFYLAAGIVFMTGLILQSIATVYATHMLDVGLSAEFVATIASIYSLAMAVTKILIGVLYDRFGLRLVMALCQLATSVSLFLMAALSASDSGKISSLLFALLFAIAIPLETLVIPLIVNDLFGSASYIKILGIFTAMNYAGYAIGCPLVNLGYDIIGSYAPIFLAFGILMLPACLIFQRIILTAQQERSRISSASETE